MVTFTHVAKSFDGYPVLQDINFSVEHGEMVCLIGQSGVGKSTITHMIIGAEKPDRGEVLVKGNSVSQLKGSDLQKFRRTVGFVFQDYKLLPEKTVFENVAFALEVTGQEEGFIHQKTMEALFSVGMLELKDRFPSHLSGGEKQRVAIARAIVHAPDLLIADEPTGNLDPENTTAIAEVLKKLNKDHTMTIVLTTHNPSFVRELAPRILLVEQGEITKDLPVGTLFPNYKY